MGLKPANDNINTITDEMIDDFDIIESEDGDGGTEIIKASDDVAENIVAINEPLPKRVSKQIDTSKVNIQIPEEMIMQAAMISGANNNYHRLLTSGQKYREANLTPAFFTNFEQTLLRVTAIEYIENPRMLN